MVLWCEFVIRYRGFESFRYGSWILEIELKERRCKCYDECCSNGDVVDCGRVSDVDVVGDYVCEVIIIWWEFIGNNESCCNCDGVEGGGEGRGG